MGGGGGPMYIEIDRYSFNILNIFTLQAGFSCHSPTTCFFFNFPFFMDFQIVHKLIFQVGFWFHTLHADVCFTLYKYMLAFFF